MKVILIIASLFFLVSCQKVTECTPADLKEDCKEYLKYDEYDEDQIIPVCGVKEDNTKKTFNSHCYACQNGSKFTVQGKCEEYDKNAQFCSPQQKTARRCKKDITQHCGYQGNHFQCNGRRNTSTGNNRCQICKIEHVLYTLEGKCPY